MSHCILASLAIILCHTKIFLSTEIDYVKVLNRILPRDIRVLGWCPVPAGFDARLAMFHVLYCSFFLQGWMYYFANKHIWLYLLTSVNSKEIKCSIFFVIRLLCVQLYGGVTLWLLIATWFFSPTAICRFTCLSREYKYLFWKGDLDILVLTLPLIFILAQSVKTCHVHWATNFHLQAGNAESCIQFHWRTWL